MESINPKFALYGTRQMSVLGLILSSSPYLSSSLGGFPFIRTLSYFGKITPHPPPSGRDDVIYIQPLNSIAILTTFWFYLEEIICSKLV